MTPLRRIAPLTVTVTVAVVAILGGCASSASDDRVTLTPVPRRRVRLPATTLPTCTH